MIGKKGERKREISKEGGMERERERERVGRSRETFLM